LKDGRCTERSFTASSTPGERLFRYRENYPEIAADAAFQGVLDNLAETSEVDHLLCDFLTKMVLENK
jgi:hypothetical protein